jgi:hypothetical protein
VLPKFSHTDSRRPSKIPSRSLRKVQNQIESPLGPDFSQFHSESTTEPAPCHQRASTDCSWSLGETRVGPIRRSCLLLFSTLFAVLRLSDQDCASPEFLSLHCHTPAFCSPTSSFAAADTKMYLYM